MTLYLLVNFLIPFRRSHFLMTTFLYLLASNTVRLIETVVVFSLSRHLSLPHLSQLTLISYRRGRCFPTLFLVFSSPSLSFYFPSLISLSYLFRLKSSSFSFHFSAWEGLPLWSPTPPSSEWRWGEKKGATGAITMSKTAGSHQQTNGVGILGRVLGSKLDWSGGVETPLMNTGIVAGWWGIVRLHVASRESDY